MSSSASKGSRGGSRNSGDSGDSNTPAGADQTPKKWRELAGQIPGTGVFLFTQGGGYNKSIVANVGYETCLREAARKPEGFVAFKWVPHIAATTIQVKVSTNRRCAGRCRRSCATSGCFCVDGRCR